MMRIFSSLLLFVSLVSTTTFAASLPSLRDTYASIPQDYLPLLDPKTATPLAIEERVKLIKVEDKRNAYLEAEGTEAISGIQMALFKKKDGTHLIGLSYNRGDHSEVVFMLTKEGEVWKDLTKDVLPTITAEMVDKRAQEKIPEFKKNNRKLTDSASGTYAYRMPRKGTTINVVVRSDGYTGKPVTLWTLKFDGNKFAISK